MDHRLEKRIWSEDDFEKLSWHDAKVHALAFDADRFELLLDLDYLFQWVNPAPGETYFSFWVAPCTLVFENAENVRFDLLTGAASGLGFEIFDIERGPPIALPEHAELSFTWDYTIHCQEGDLTLRATGFKLYVRQPPRLQRSQGLDLGARGGISFERAFEESLEVD